MLNQDTAHAQVRDTALALPETEERDATFLVAGEPFARIDKEMTLHVRSEEGWAELPLADDTDWALVADRIARSWELAAPAGLLEAGGR